MVRAIKAGKISYRKFFSDYSINFQSILIKCTCSNHSISTHDWFINLLVLDLHPLKNARYELTQVYSTFSAKFLEPNILNIFSKNKCLQKLPIL